MPTAVVLACGEQVVFGNRTTYEVNEIFLSYAADVLEPVTAKFAQVRRVGSGWWLVAGEV